MDIECLIIGGGPAGLTAGTYLGRFRRRTLLVDAGQSRVAWIPITQNLPGFTEGISGPDLLNRMGAQSDQYGAKRLTGTVEPLTKSKTDKFQATVGQTEITAQRVLLATGGLDVDPRHKGLIAVLCVAAPIGRQRRTSNHEKIYNAGAFRRACVARRLRLSRP
jgi:thioredoxin reductase (NADPH)